MAKKFRVAMVGLGFGAEFIPIYQRHPLGSVEAICRRNEQELNAVGDKFGIAKRYTKYEQVLADKDIDFVHINSPIPDHGWMSIEALKAGKHVMCTVPMSTSIDECEKICQLVQDTGLKYMMAETVSTAASSSSSRTCTPRASWARSSTWPPPTRRTWTAGPSTGNA